MLRRIILGFGVVLLLTASALAFPAGWWLHSNVSDFFDDKPDVARADSKQLEIAVLEYYKKRGYFPESLFQLVERDLIDGDMEIYKYPVSDPWGEHYKIDSRQLHSTRGVPLIWSEGRPGRKKRITNWD